jgi:hypothetical protein
MKRHVKASQRTLDVAKPRLGWSWQEIAFLSTTFLGSFLLFQIQPLIGKMILPWFGGTASVWTMCLLFFQTVLFVGYLYAHLTSVYLAPRVQVILHCVVILAAMLTLPILPSDAWRESATANPGFGVLQVLAFSVGLPYFLLSTNAPLLQRWWAAVVKASPYHLYSLSNAGSLLALLTYTLIAERLLGTRMISYLWTILFVVLGLMLFRCLVWVWQRQATDAASVAKTQSDSADKLQLGQRKTQDLSTTNQTGSVPTWTSRALWLFLASTGTTVLMSVTNFLCQDIASVPMMWLAPLTLYLLSFILCFSTKSWYRRKWFIPMMTVFSFLAAMTYGQLFSHISMTWLLSINLLALLGVFMVVHGEMERAKPAAEYLTQYFLFVSGGGMLGGFYVGLVAPLIYPEYYELPLVMILVGLIPLAILLLDGRSPLYRGRRAWAWVIVVAIFGWHGMVWSYGYLQRYSSVWSTGRNFYGVLKVSIGTVSESSQLMYVSLMNGHITHGSQLAKVSGEGEQQSLDLLPLPTTYYAEESAIGRIFRATQNDRPRRIGAVGLGTGTIGSYARKGDLFRFYEINPKVVEIAQETFSFLSIIKESEGDYEVVMGDARLSLESETAQNYDIITVDAFSGDSIPVHLLTREAATIYLKHLHPDGYIAFHISNRYVDLMPVVYDIARQNGLELVSYQNKADFQTGTYQSEWVVLRRPGNNQVIPEFNFYPTSMLKGKATVWTDDRSSLFEIMKW